jgi:hypothetical protein
MIPVLQIVHRCDKVDIVTVVAWWGKVKSPTEDGADRANVQIIIPMLIIGRFID